MSHDATIRATIERIAPDVDASSIPDDVDFREFAELDSMDFLGVLAAVAAATGVEVPESAYPSVTTIAAFAEFVTTRSSVRP